MTELIVKNCGECPFAKPAWGWYCGHPKQTLTVCVSIDTIDEDCPLIKEDTVIKINVNE